MAFVITSPFPLSHHEHQSSDSVFHPPGVVPMARVPRNPANSDTGRKRKLDDLDRRLTQAENQLTRHNDRLDNVELRLELDQSYRCIRVEACKGLEEMFAKVETGEVLGRPQLVGLVLAACPTAQNGVAVTRDYQASAS